MLGINVRKKNSFWSGYIIRNKSQVKAGQIRSNQIIMNQIKWSVDFKADLDESCKGKKIKSYKATSLERRVIVGYVVKKSQFRTDHIVKNKSQVKAGQIKLRQIVNKIKRSIRFSAKQVWEDHLKEKKSIRLDHQKEKSNQLS